MPVNRFVQHQSPGTDTSKWNAAIIDVITYPYVFPCSLLFSKQVELHAESAGLNQHIHFLCLGVRACYCFLYIVCKVQYACPSSLTSCGIKHDLRSGEWIMLEWFECFGAFSSTVKSHYCWEYIILHIYSVIQADHGHCSLLRKFQLLTTIYEAYRSRVFDKKDLERTSN